MKLTAFTQSKVPFTLAGSLGLGLLLALSGAGCRAVQSAAELPGVAIRSVTPGRQKKSAADPVEVQQALLRFTDEYAMRMISSVENLRRGTNALLPAEALNAKIALASETCAIASGPNAIANLLDMTIFVTGTRMGLEDYWLPKVFGESARPMLEFARNAEPQIWRLAALVLSPEQQQELLQVIEAWHRQNPLRESVVTTRAIGLAAQLADTSKHQATRPGSVFSLLNVDPLAGMEPAVRELAQTRLFAERALFVAQKLPMLLRWQTELLAANSTELPAIAQLVTNSTHLAGAVKRFATVAEKLPDQINTQREETLKALEGQESKLTPLVNEVRQTLVAGSQMSTSLNATITTFDGLMKRLGVGEPSAAAPPDTNSPPFNILDYAQTAEQVEKMARQLTELLQRVDETTGSNQLSRISKQFAPVVQQAQSGGKEIVDYAFWKGILLVAIGLLAALIYRFLTVRMTAPRSESNSP